MYRVPSRATEEGNGKYDECLQHIYSILSPLRICLSASSSLLDEQRYTFRCLLVELACSPLFWLGTFLTLPG